MEPNANAHAHTLEDTGPSSRGGGDFRSGGGGWGFRIYDEYTGPSSRGGKRPMYGDSDTSMRTKKPRIAVDESMADVIDLDSPDTGNARIDETNTGIENLDEYMRCLNDLDAKQMISKKPYFQGANAFRLSSYSRRTFLLLKPEYWVDWLKMLWYCVLSNFISLDNFKAYME
ncbi:hypothetical protein FH972_026696 [Carpinus fangiana]|uniref:Uncharacterized protein n=1 Tax=Carpinus fangiana TaxID=176857 RepID=A0A5N6L4S4_9ROSI|nr:hypothetical protein FH972_026696 [Carpinus fangiana]